MKKTTNKRKTTTISCDESARVFIAAEAERTGRLQREVLAEMISVYKLQQERSATKKKEMEDRKKNALELFKDINAKLDTAVKRDDTVIAFIRKQEKDKLSPMSQKIDKCESLLNTLVGILESFQSESEQSESNQSESEKSEDNQLESNYESENLGSVNQDELQE